MKPVLFLVSVSADEVLVYEDGVAEFLLRECEFIYEFLEDVGEERALADLRDVATLSQLVDFVRTHKDLLMDVLMLAEPKVYGGQA